ncbi:hypothetical protein D3C85_1643100 [compost metagenome]
MDSLVRILCSCFWLATRSPPFLSFSVRISSAFTVMRPAHGCSRKLMQRKNVLLPEPEEPIMLITSPALALIDTPLSTSWLP